MPDYKRIPAAGGILPTDRETSALRQMIWLAKSASADKLARSILNAARELNALTEVARARGLGLELHVSEIDPNTTERPLLSVGMLDGERRPFLSINIYQPTGESPCPKNQTPSPTKS